jgi:hypothetical protein
VGEPTVTVHGEPAAAEPAPAAAPPASPSAELVRKAAMDEVLTDERGRKLHVRKPGVLAQFRLTEAVGPEAAANQTYMQMINPLIYLAAIDGEEVHLPASKREVEVLIVRLEDEGLACLMAWYVVNVLGPTMDAMRAAEQQSQIKNS